MAWRKDLVGASGLDVTGLLALVADALTLGLSRAVAGDMANLAAWETISIEREVAIKRENPQL